MFANITGQPNPATNPGPPATTPNMFVNNGTSGQPADNKGSFNLAPNDNKQPGLGSNQLLNPDNKNHFGGATGGFSMPTTTDNKPQEQNKGQSPFGVNPGANLLNGGNQNKSMTGTNPQPTNGQPGTTGQNPAPSMFSNPGTTGQNPAPSMFSNPGTTGQNPAPSMFTNPGTTAQNPNDKKPTTGGITGAFSNPVMGNANPITTKPADATNPNQFATKLPDSSNLNKLTTNPTITNPIATNITDPTLTNKTVVTTGQAQMNPPASGNIEQPKDTNEGKNFDLKI